MTCRRGLADRDFLAVLAPARVERALRVEATISVGTEIVAQALQQIGRAASRDAAVVIAERRREGGERHQRPRLGIKSGSHHQVRVTAGAFREGTFAGTRANRRDAPEADFYGVRIEARA